MVIVCHNTVR